MDVMHALSLRTAGGWRQYPKIFSDLEFETFMGKLHWMLPYNLSFYHFTGRLSNNPIMRKRPATDAPLEQLLQSAPEYPLCVKDRRSESMSECKVFQRLENWVVMDTPDGYGRVAEVAGGRFAFIAEYEAAPLTFAQAREIAKAHRHNAPPIGHKFSIGLKERGKPEYIGAVIASVPKARALAADPYTLDINRVCVDERYFNANSKLYSLAVRAGKAMGYRTFVTYTLPEESGSTPRAVGFHEAGLVSAREYGWDAPSRPRKNDGRYPVGEKIRWVLKID